LRKAFTLIELLVVLALVSLLISVVGPSGKKMYEKFFSKLDKIERVGLEYDNRYLRFLEDKQYFENTYSNEINTSRETI